MYKQRTEFSLLIGLTIEDTCLKPSPLPVIWVMAAGLVCVSGLLKACLCGGLFVLML